MTRIALVLAALFALLLSACGQAATSAADRPAALWTDADRYDAAMAQAIAIYAEEVAHAELAYPGTELTVHRFDALLAECLAQHGLTMHGLQVTADRHPGFRQALALRHAERVVDLHERATGNQQAYVASAAHPIFAPALASR
jgi:hypothetical protein